ncbi:MAG: hypothetical protein LUG98_13330 [Tannerellaceae bacterium]|nr:hypothetical protein [Tannerellaceae bacterium]
MNKREVISSVARRSGISEEICEQVLDSLEEVFTDEVSGSAWKGGAFDKLYRIMGYFRGKRKSPFTGN